MRVVVNQLSALGRKTGIGHYASELLRCLQLQQGSDRIDGFAPDWVKRAWLAWQGLRSHWKERKTSHLRPRSSWRRTGKSNLPGPVFHRLRDAGLSVVAQHFRRFCDRERYALYHEPNYIPLPCDLPTVATLADLSVLLNPEWHPADRVAYYERYFSQGIRRCLHFLAISEFGRQEIIRHLGIAPDKVTRTYVGIRSTLGPLPPDHVAATLQQLHLPPRYLLYVGTIEPRKNLLMLLRAYCDLPDRLRSHWPLLLVGDWGWNTGEVAEFLHIEARHRGVIHVGYVAEEHLAAMYNGARALVYPSFYEGFGLPPVEMTACGGAVLASTAGAIVETVGGRAHLLNPRDLAGWRDAMVRVIEDDGWWQSLRQGGREVAQVYTWERCAAETVYVYRALCGFTTHCSSPIQRAA